MIKIKSIFSDFPSEEELLDWYRTQPEKEFPDINAHIHTPHSYSAFSDIGQPFKMAKSEGVSILGINDFYTTAGYPEFASEALKYNVFPLFNIEFMALQSHLMEQGILVNDPSNPGRTYFSGKGLRYPVKMSDKSLEKIENLKNESNRQTFKMVEKLNAHLSVNSVDLKFDADLIKKELARDLLRERHIARAIRIAVFEKESQPDRRKYLLRQIFGGSEVESVIENIVDIENEIRSKLLKSGGAAFVPEDQEAFLSLEEVMDIIIDAGGIPCYPVLLDNPQGVITPFESDRDNLLKELKSRDIYSIEFIPGRNDLKILKDYVTFFHDNGFVVTFGTEHNTPRLDPVAISCRGGIPLDATLKRINYEGAAIIAAHQYLIAGDREGYLQGKKAKIQEKEEFSRLGRAVITWYHEFSGLSDHE